VWRLDVPYGLFLITVEKRQLALYTYPGTRGSSARSSMAQEEGGRDPGAGTRRKGRAGG